MLSIHHKIQMPELRRMKLVLIREEYSGNTGRIRREYGENTTCIKYWKRDKWCPQSKVTGYKARRRILLDAEGNAVDRAGTSATTARENNIKRRKGRAALMTLTMLCLNTVLATKRLMPMGGVR